MGYMENMQLPQEFIDFCLKHEGGEYQDLSFMEECSEVIKAVTKLNRRKREGYVSEKNIHELEEEIADLILTAQICITNHGLNTENITRTIHEKLHRTKDTIGGYVKPKISEQELESVEASILDMESKFFG